MLCKLLLGAWRRPVCGFQKLRGWGRGERGSLGWRVQGPADPPAMRPSSRGPKPGVDMELGIPFTAMFLSREEALGMKTAALSSQSREKVGHRTKAGPPWKPVQPLATARLPGCSLVQRPSARGPWGASPPPLRFLKPRLGPAEPTPGGGGEASGGGPAEPTPDGGGEARGGGRGLVGAAAVPWTCIAPSTAVASAAACPGCACAGPTPQP